MASYEHHRQMEEIKATVQLQAKAMAERGDNLDMMHKLVHLQRAMVKEHLATIEALTIEVATLRCQHTELQDRSTRREAEDENTIAELRAELADRDNLVEDMQREADQSDQQLGDAVSRVNSVFETMERGEELAKEHRTRISLQNELIKAKDEALAEADDEINALKESVAALQHQLRQLRATTPPPPSGSGMRRHTPHRSRSTSPQSRGSTEEGHTQPLDEEDVPPVMSPNDTEEGQVLRIRETDSFRNHVDKDWTKPSGGRVAVVAWEKTPVRPRRGTSPDDFLSDGSESPQDEWEAVHDEAGSAQRQARSLPEQSSADIEDLRRELTIRTQECSVAHDRLAEAEREIRDIHRRNIELEEKVAHMHMENAGDGPESDSAAAQRIEALKLLVAEDKRLITRQSNEIDSLKNQLDRSMADATKASTENVQLRVQLQEAKRMADDDSAVAQLQREKEQLLASLDEAMKARQAAVVALDRSTQHTPRRLDAATQDKLSFMRSRMDKLENDAALSKAQLRQKEEEVEVLRAKVAAKPGTKPDNTVAIIASQREEIDRLQSQIQHYRDRADAAQHSSIGLSPVPAGGGGVSGMMSTEQALADIVDLQMLIEHYRQTISDLEKNQSLNRAEIHRLTERINTMHRADSRAQA